MKKANVYLINTYMFYLKPFTLQITFGNDVGKFDLEVTTFQMAVLFSWNQRPKDKLSFESLRLATELPDAELRRTLIVKYFIILQLL